MAIIILSRAFRSISIYRLYTHTNFLRQCKWFPVRFALWAHLNALWSGPALLNFREHKRALSLPVSKSLPRYLSEVQYLRPERMPCSPYLTIHYILRWQLTVDRHVGSLAHVSFSEMLRAVAGMLGCWDHESFPIWSTLTDRCQIHWEKTSKSGFHKRRNRKSSGMSRFMRERDREKYIYILYIYIYIQDITGLQWHAFKASWRPYSMMDRDRSSARHLSTELEDPLRPESSQIPEKMLPWCPKFRDLAGWLPQIAPSDLAPSDETQDHEETVLNVGQPWLHIVAQPSCVFLAKTSTQLKWDYRPQSKCKLHRKKRLRWAAFSWRVHNLTMLRNGGTTRICDENPNTFGVIFQISQETSR